MSKPKQSLVGKASKASLKSRGLSTTTSNAFSEGYGGCYSLYSTDSEDNVAGVNKGLDKCAELLTNILEIKATGKDMKKSSCPIRKKFQKPIVPKSMKQRPTKSGVAKSEPKTLKSKAAIIHIPTGQETQNNENVQKSRTVYNERVVASTPVLTIEQRKQLQEIHKRENDLKQQLQLLQEEYENLQHLQKKNTEPIGSINDPYKQQVADVNNNQVQKTKSPRSSLDFGINAEKPFDDCPQVQGKTPNSTKYTTDKATDRELDRMRRVQFSQITPESQKRQSFNNTQQSMNDNKMTESHHLCSQKDNELYESSASLSPKESRNSTKLKNEPASPKQLSQQYSDHLKTLRYMFRELKAVLTPSGDSEVERLLTEIEDEIRLLTSVHPPICSPSLSSDTKIKEQHDIDTEIALQPLRSENSDLRRKLRIANQRMRDMEEQLKAAEIHSKERVDCTSRYQIESMEMTIRAKNKEVDLLKLTIEQRDAEIERLTELTRGLQESLTKVLSSVQDLHPEHVRRLSDTSTLSGMDFWKPTNERKFLPSMLPKVTHKPIEIYSDESDEELNLKSLKTGNCEYSNIKTSSVRTTTYHEDNDTLSLSQDTQSSSQSIDREGTGNDDTDTTLSVTSADEFVFKQELANLDIMIARLQHSLRNK